LPNGVRMFRRPCGCRWGLRDPQCHNWERARLVTVSLSVHPTSSAADLSSTLPSAKFKRNAMLTLGALGIVYGDIGTSPLYALRESALAAGHHATLHDAIMGVTSLIIWALIVVVTLKYVVLIMRADKAAFWHWPRWPIVATA